MKVNLNPQVSYAKEKKDGTTGKWIQAEADSWFIYDASEDVSDDHVKQDLPGVCIAFYAGNRSVSISIALDDLIRAAADIVEAKSDQWKPTL